MSGFAGL